MKYLFFDTETSGLPKNYKLPVTDTDNWPRLIQLAYIIANDDQEILHESDTIIYPDGFVVDPAVEKIHGISHKMACRDGKPLGTTIDTFLTNCYSVETLVAHNMAFDEKIIGAELVRLGIDADFNRIRKICTMKSSTNYCKIPGPYGYKWPRLQEVYWLLFNEKFEGAHNALIDMRATIKVFFELKRIGVIK